VRVRPLTLLAALALAAPGTAAAATIHGTKHADRIDVVGGGVQTVKCSAGRDIVTADQNDHIARDCEVVSRRISIDTITAPPGQHQSEVEPDVEANGSTAVAVFQLGRITDGGATGIGWATSANAGRTWRFGLLPGVTTASTPPGTAPRASDPAVAYDAAHGVWLAATLIIGNGFTALGISRSQDGFTWSEPVLAGQLTQAGLGFDKEWIACDNASTSPRYGSCYLVYTELSLTSPRLALTSSHDGGATWGTPVAVATTFSGEVEGALPLVQPDGSLTVVFQGNEVGLYVARSVDGGVTFTAPLGIALMTSSRHPALRAPSLPTATVDASGRMYVAWADCSLRPGCAADDIVVMSSTDGVAWTEPARIPVTTLDGFVPDIAADPATPGRLGLVTYVLTAAGRIGVLTTTSRDGGKTWTKVQRLDALSPLPTWLANTVTGRFLGDYVGATFAAGRFVPVFALAQPPVQGSLREYMMAASLP
jgi:hypothetical protein